jgi:signal transduction histidine kinase
MKRKSTQKQLEQKLKKLKRTSVTYKHAKRSLKASIETHFEVPEKLIQDPLKILIYRIMQEALNNVAKHSQADEVMASLRLVSNNNEVELVIEDNGRGFDLSEVQAMDFQKRGVGLESIKERTVIFGGALDIQTKPGQGTRIRVCWPC